MSENSEELERFKALLGEIHIWPSEFPFKFIVDSKYVEDIKDILGNHQDISVKPSRKGNYASVSVSLVMESSEEVLVVYSKASKIEGIISL